MGTGPETKAEIELRQTASIEYSCISLNYFFLLRKWGGGGGGFTC